MSYNVIPARSFKHSVKRLQKRFPHVKDDVRVAIQVLLQAPRLGVVVPGGSGVHKLRVRNTDLGKGKSGGYRLLYYVEDQPVPIIYLLLLYAKSDREDVTRQELKQLLDELGEEMGE
ncbi:MAG: type II toxin-antitoxin system RelE/ParE family toxin [Chloroflexi bacterium]|nr:type II toxin-antitoxin system RelE/ParE family toxin [Chloroflexota bacterium]